MPPISRRRIRALIFFGLTFILFSALYANAAAGFFGLALKGGGEVYCFLTDMSSVSRGALAAGGTPRICFIAVCQVIYPPRQQPPASSFAAPGFASW